MKIIIETKMPPPNTRHTYVPPHKRNTTNLFRNKQPKFTLVHAAFPELNTSTLVEETTMNFKEKIEQELPKIYKSNKDVEPGFIRWKYNNKLQTWTRKDGCMKETEDNMREHDLFIQQEKQIALINRWQDYRDIQNELLTDRSPFWNMPHILSNTEENMEKNME